MKRAGLWTIGIGMLFIVGILTVKQVYPRQDKTETECSLATVQGTYLFAGISYNIIPPPNGTDPDPADPKTLPQISTYIAVAGRSIYDGKGGSDTLAKLTVNGVHVPDSIEKGTYTVEKDCTGTETIPDPNSTLGQHTYATIVAPDGSQIVFLGTDPVTDNQGVVRASVSKRVAP